MKSAETEKRWQIIGTNETGHKLGFPVSAYTHAEAKAKAERMLKARQSIHTIKLVEKYRK